jgi:hypothetical protein
MMTTGRTQAAGKRASDKGFAPAPEPIELSDEDRSKDGFFVQLADIAEAMIAEHGREFTMGALVLTAKFIAEGKPLTKAAAAAAETQRKASGPS